MALTYRARETSRVLVTKFGKRLQKLTTRRDIVCWVSLTND